MPLALRPPLLVALLALPLALAGCGGAGAGPERASVKTPAPTSGAMVKGRLAVQVSWPRRTSSRVVPTASRSMRIELWAGGLKAAETLLVAPATTAVFTTYPVGAVQARVTAYSEADGTGVPVAKGTGNGTFDADADASIPVTLASTTVSIDGYPSAHFGNPDDTSTFEVYAQDADGNTVAQDPADTTWVSSDPAVATVSPMGTVVMHAEGEATITLKDRNSGQTCELNVTVINPE